MKTSIVLSKNPIPTNPLNTISRDKKQSIDAQNRSRVQKKRIIDELNQISAEATNNENLDNNVMNNNRNEPFRPSIGKWMFESDEYLAETALDLSASKDKDNDSTANASDDDIQVIETFSAGPSGSNTRSNENTIEEVAKIDVKDLTLILDCDLNPSLLTSGLNISIYDIDIDDKEVSFEDKEVITIDDDDNEELTPNKLTVSSSSSASSIGTETETETNTADDIEIIRVKVFNPPTNDSDVEVLSEILSPPEVIDLMKNYLHNVQKVTNLSFTTLRLLMSKYNWDRELFGSQLCDIKIEQMLKYFNITISYELKSNTKRRRLKQRPDLQTQSSSGSESTTDGIASETQMKTCLVCFDESNASDMYGSNCGHYLCIDCWNQYVSTHVNDRSSGDIISCPGDNCPHIIDDEDLMAIIKDQNVCDKYRRLISNSFVHSYPLLRWCPNGDCLHAVRVKEGGFQDIECVCKTVFCFLCGDRWHEPLSCAQHKNWIQKYAQQTIDKKSANWLTKHTKCCPKCRFPIEKNGGCNYVMCLKCRHQFCYNCLGVCSHGRCLGQNAMDALQAQAIDQRVKDDLQMYPNIKDQYQKQLNQFSMESKLQKDVSKKLESAVKCPEFRSALKFLKSSFSVLCHCRQTLIYSYVFGYYLLGPNQQKQVYLENLKHLETQTEYLSHVLRTETAVIQKDSVEQIRREVQPIYRDCESKRSRLVGHIRQGLTRNEWQFFN